ncbi:LysR family transcriptional regulator [Haliangium ochraceum]|uniref:Transcriptional regulator, LysR family n=1 Tax=Haliangium ochraceum (strain DSM 14365 / JCM 11303 / SMP-2) TaxID=502025 RepID=D0LVX7_HALO1|nr:LysR family transcriptional regulator [Haliangium ochraceum]ACY14111.1 transcriptional regulator, LysR family [Haliangium ochraceum DSM 14365]
MHLQAIRAFVHTVELGSFAAVARAERVSPSSISRLVSELETELCVRLFQRTTRRLSLTEAGRVYLDRVAPLLEELERARDLARELSATPRGVLRVACAPTFAQMHLARWLPSFLQRYPELDVELVLEVGVTDLIAARIDVALRLGRVDGATLVAKKLCEMPRVVVASPQWLDGRRLRPADVSREPCLVFAHAGVAPLWRFRDRRARVREYAPRQRVLAPDGVVLRRLAVAGLGLALLARWACAEELASGALVDVFPRHAVTATEFDAAVYCVYPSRSYLPLKVRLFVDFVTEIFRDGPPWTQQQPSCIGG